ncbi:hypothetical protein Pyn_39684 [Prunus yedoensis var. nudiflora]|uniref:Uncharacterized protein n=1 Tax=Prunus yedoensis var. nudiflora TaxID=2094558 RepID=A0A314YI91_PRUYE|nr:hypothetical protein Pyn_39684 [Prunus yedoensis var. nudiflora]
MMAKWDKRFLELAPSTAALHQRVFWNFLFWFMGIHGEGREEERLKWVCKYSLPIRLHHQHWHWNLLGGDWVGGFWKLAGWFFGRRRIRFNFDFLGRGKKSGVEEI